MLHLGLKASFLYESCLVTTPKPRADAPLVLKGHTLDGGDDPGPPRPRRRGSLLAPPPPGASQRPFVPLSPGLPILEKFQEEKYQRQRLIRRAVVTLADTGEILKWWF